MIVSFDRSFLEIPLTELRSYYPQIQYLLGLHSRREILLHVLPLLISRLSSDDAFGIANKTILNAISKRVQDYSSLLVRIPRYIKITPENEGHIRDNDRHSTLRINLVYNFFEQCSYLFTENSSTDGNFYSLICNHYIELKLGANNITHAKRFHGGGGTLADAVRDLRAVNLLGIAICDRDTTGAVPPFPKHTTGEAMLDCCTEHAVVSIDNNILNHCRPFFRFHATEGWGLENYLGPHLCEAFFLSNNNSIASRSAFVSAFPTFPILNDIEYKEWFLSNMKIPNQSIDSLSDGVARMSLNTSAARRSIIASLKIPSDAIKWVLANYNNSKNSNIIRDAINADLQSEFYSDAINHIATEYLCIFAADPRVRLM